MSLSDFSPGRMLDGLLDGAMVLAGGHVLHANRALCGMLGYASGGLAGRAFAEVCARQQTTFEDLYADAEYGPILDVTLTFVGCDGTDIPLAVRGGRLRGDLPGAGCSEVLLLVVQDVTETKLLVEEALAASQVKAEFMTNMSHELRTPMNAVMAMGQLLVNTETSEEQRGYLETLLEGGRMMLRILDEILEFSSVDSGNVELKLEPFCIQSEVDHLVHRFALQAAHAELALRTVIDPAVPRELVGDAARVSKVLAILVDNALKFTREGGVVVSLGVVSAVADRVELRMSVQDSGVGIAHDQLEQVFQPFYQVDGTSTRQGGGAGLGLATARDLVALMAGQIGLNSELGRGTEAWVRLPLGIPMSRSEREKSAALASGKRIATPHVLLVDDNAIGRKTGAALLRKLSCECVLASDGAEAVAAAAQRRFDLILMDLQMPNVDGFAATATILSSCPHNQGTPIIAFTANAMVECRDRCLDIGMVDVLPKPTGLAPLQAVLEEYCQPRSGAVASDP